MRPKFWPNSIEKKISLFVIVPLAISLTITSFYIGSREKEFLMNQYESKISLLAEHTIQSIQNVMLTGHADLAGQLVTQGVEEIKLLQILRKDGTEAFRDLKTIEMVNATLGGNFFERKAKSENQVLDGSDPALLRILRTGQKVDYYETKDGELLLTLLIPIVAGEKCKKCHEYDEHRVRGIVRISASTAGITAKINYIQRRLLIGLALTIIMVITLIKVLVKLVIAKPIKILHKGAELIGSGKLEHRFDIKGRDEIGDLAASFNQMAENLQRLKELRERKEFLEMILSNVSDSIIIYDQNGKILSFSRGSEEIFGFKAEEVMGKDYNILGPGRSFALLQAQAGKIFRGEIPLQRRGGDLFHAYLTITPLVNEKGLIALIEAARDVTEDKRREKLERQLMQSEKLAAIGQLAAGVAHEINNPLGNILLYATHMIKNFNPDDIKFKNLERIIDNVTRSKAIVGDLLDYARDSLVTMTANNINEVVERSVNILKSEMKLNEIECTLDMAEALPTIQCDRNRIQQVLVNLLHNAIQAIGFRGTIKVSTCLADDRKSVCVSVSDSGEGIEPNVLPRIFEPFYTTKENGTGLGLSISYGIIEMHRGRIWAESGFERGRENGGTTVYFELPLSQKTGKRYRWSPAEGLVAEQSE